MMTLGQFRRTTAHLHDDHVLMVEFGNEPLEDKLAKWIGGGGMDAMKSFLSCHVKAQGGANVAANRAMGMLESTPSTRND